MKRWLLGGAGVAVVVLLGWLAFSETIVLPDLGGVFGSSGEDSGGSGDATDSGDDGRRPAPVSATAYSGSGEVDDHGPEDGVLVQVVAKGDGRRLAGAEVTFLDPAQVDPSVLQEAFLSGGRDLEAMLRRFGRRYRADRNGELRLPRFQEQAGVMARHGPLFGVQEIRTGLSDPIRLELEASSSLLVQVVDEDGNPCPGVPLALRFRSGAFPSDVWRGQAQGPAAMAEIANFRALLPPDAGPSDGALAIVLAAPLRALVEVPVDPEATPPDPVRLTVPRTGNVTIHVQDLDGSPVRHGALVSLDVVSEASDEQGWLHGALVNHPARVDDGVAHFPFVGLGLRLKAEAWMGDRVRPATATFAGPEAAGGGIAVDLAFRDRYPAVVGRACDDNGTVLRSCALRAILRDRADMNGGTSGGPVRTDEEGRFRVVVKEGPGASGGRELELVLQDPAVARIRAVGFLQVPDALPPGDTDVGMIVLRPAPLVASGEVVDEAGRPVRGARVVVESRSDEGDGWAPEPDLSTVSDARGRFLVQGRLSAREIRVRATRDHHLAGEPVAAGAGAQGIRILLARGGSVEGSVVLDGGVRGADLEAVLLPASGPETAVRLDAGGRFRFSASVPGTCRVGVRIREARAPFAIVGDVLVKAGETARDARLDPLDLRGRLRSAVITVTDGDGDPVPDFVVDGDPAAGSGHLPSSRGIGGRARLILADPSVDVVVSASGYRPASVRGVAGDRRVVLRGGIPVRLVLAGGAVPPPSPFRLEAVLVPAAAAPGMAGHVPPAIEPRPVDGEGKLRILLPSPGRWRVSWLVTRRGRWPSAGVGLPADVASVIDVADLDAEQTIPVSLPAGALAEALRAL